MKTKNTLLVLLIVLFSCSSGTKELGPQAFVNWVNDDKNGLKVSKVIEDFEFTLLYKPLEYNVVMQEKNEQIKREEFDTLKKEYEGLQYFTLKIQSKTTDEMMKTGISSELEYFERLEYFVSMMQDDISLVIGNDTIPCSLYHFERNYRLAPYNNINLGFEAGKINEDVTLVYNDRVLGTGPVKMSITKESIENIPNLQIN